MPSYDERPSTRDAREHRPPACVRDRAPREAPSGATTGAGGSGRSRPLPRSTCRPARRPPLAGETHKSPNHVGFPGITDGKYPRGDLTRVMSGDISVHASTETRRYLATVPGRFEFVSAPRHGSWLNLVEGLFSRMTRQMLRHIRVSSKDELKERILRYFREVNAEPVVYRWKWNLSDVDPTTEELVVDTLLPDGAGKAS